MGSAKLIFDRLNSHSDIPFRDSTDPVAVKARIQRFTAHLRHVQHILVQILSFHQSHATTEDEFARIYECLESIDEVQGYLTRRTGSVAVFFPLNMTVYAFVLYAMFPALVAEHVYVRSPQITTKLMQDLLPVLDLSNHFPNIEVMFESRETFVRKYVATADVVIFTGKLANAQQVMSKTRRDSLFLFNGWGCNPIVVGEDADLDDAAAKTVAARLFSSGQDCAAPDTILVHQQIQASFLEKLSSRLRATKIGDYGDPDVVVGPLADGKQLQLAASILAKSNAAIQYGGCIDFKRSIVHPSTIVHHINDQMNFEELFSPLFFVNIYDHDAQLSEYFEHPRYVANEMYVSLFGRSEFVESLKRSIIIRERVVFDLDRGNDEFGGYSVGASFVASCRTITAKPVLVPRDIFEHLDPNSGARKLTLASQRKIGKQVRKAIEKIFHTNLVFGFVFGSIARGDATGVSDINTMLVVEQYESGQSALYKEWLYNLHLSHRLSARDGISAVIVSLGDLDCALQSLKPSDVPHQLHSAHPVSLYVEALSGVQCGVAGNKQLSVQYSQSVFKYARLLHENSSLPSLRSSDTIDLRKAEIPCPDAHDEHLDKRDCLQVTQSMEEQSPVKAYCTAERDASISEKVCVGGPSQRTKTSRLHRRCFQSLRRMILRT